MIIKNVHSLTQDRYAIRLIVDNSIGVQIGDKPIFGAEVTISEKIINLGGNILLPGLIIGWVNYLSESKFACLTIDNNYVEAAKYLYTDQNQLKLAKPIKLHSIERNMRETNHILTFSDVSVRMK